jgi:CRP-like cAMP-binding protein
LNSLAQKKSPTPLADPLGRNRLLAALAPDELRALERRLEYVRLPLRRSLHELGQPVRYVYFPTSGIVSLLCVNDTGPSTNLTVVGCEGMVGLELLLGGETATNRAVVQAAGSAYRLRGSDAKAVFAEGGTFQSLALRFARALIMELSQMAVCNLHHVVEQQLSRWLLLCLDRLEGDEIEMTHELIASLLGVRRQGVTEAAKKLQERKVIAYSRGRITVLDRGALEACACECYRLLKRQTVALFADMPAYRRRR